MQALRKIFLKKSQKNKTNEYQYVILYLELNIAPVYCVTLFKIIIATYLECINIPPTL
jgi:hypothetical protein